MNRFEPKITNLIELEPNFAFLKARTTCIFFYQKSLKNQNCAVRASIIDYKNRLYYKQCDQKSTHFVDSNAEKMYQNL